jgi:CarD family transcriptional regulator
MELKTDYQTFSKFKKGEKVAHPIFGVGNIANIEEKRVLDKSEKYYILDLFINQMTLMIPIRKAGDIGLRKIVDKDKIPDVLEVLNDNMDDMEQDYKSRIKTQMEMVDSGNLMKVAQVVKNYYRRKKTDPLSATEKSLLERANKILTSEIKAVYNIDENSAKVMIKENLKRDKILN